LLSLYKNFQTDDVVSSNLLIATFCLTGYTVEEFYEFGLTKSDLPNIELDRQTPKKIRDLILNGIDLLAESEPKQTGKSGSTSGTTEFRFDLDLPFENKPIFQRNSPQRFL